MPGMVQVRNVPVDVHRRLKARAALLGLSLSDYLLDELQRLSERPTLAEVLERIARRPRVKLKTSAAALIRRERDPR